MGPRLHRSPPKQMLVGNGSRTEGLRWVTSLEDDLAGEMSSPDCYPPGSGMFEEPDGRRLPCVTCKGSGPVLVSL
jgi:hypothetical protein